jgi:protein O-GlcNAc transferase
MNINESIKAVFEHLQSGNAKQAEEMLTEILAVEPDNADSLALLGIVYFHLHNYDLAIAYSEKALHYEPDSAYIYFNLGNAYREKKEYAEAISSYRKASELNPELGDAYYNLGAIFQDTNRFQEAIDSYSKALAIDPGDTDAYYNLGIVLKEAAQFEEAQHCFQKALELNPNLVGAYNHLSVIFQSGNQVQKAISCYRKALELNPSDIVAYYGLAAILKDQGHYQDAIDLYRKSLQLIPGNAGVYHNMGNILILQGKLDGAEDCYKRALQLNPDECRPYESLLLLMNYHPKYDTEAIYLKHLEFAKQFEKPLSSGIIPHTNKREPYRPLRVGYVSPDFRRHAVAWFIEPVLALHDKEMFEVCCYSNSPIKDEVTERIQGHAEQWRNITGMTDEEAAELIRKDEIDILIDLAGHTAGNRMLMFARKPAPVQASWIGYLATTGLSAMDYKIVDNYTDPPGETERFYTERLMRMPKSFLCYQPDRGGPEVGPLPALSSGRVTFGSFNNFAKVTPEVFSVWAKILDNVPDSCLILKGIGFYDKTTCDYAMDMFAERGIAGERIVLQHPDPSPEHLKAYNKIDIGLDTFPFNGAATTCEAIWMGLPVITLAGTAYHSRAGVSLLSNMGLSELVAGTKEEYISIAVNLARDLQRLESLRGNLREAMRHSPLCDAKRFTADLEKCYRRMWKTWCKDTGNG